MRGFVVVRLRNISVFVGYCCNTVSVYRGASPAEDPPADPWRISEVRGLNGVLVTACLPILLKSDCSDCLGVTMLSETVSTDRATSTLNLPSPFNHENLDDLRAIAWANATKPLDNPIYDIVRRSVFPSISHPATDPNNSSNENFPLNWSLPAHGQSKSNCGSLYRGEVCGNRGKAKTHYINGAIVRCHSPSCPVCYPWAVKRASNRARNYMLGCLDLRDNEGKESPLYHVEVSLPPEIASYSARNIKEFVKYRRSVQKHLLEFFEGGILAFHPFRQNKKGSDETLSLGGRTVWREGFHFHALVIGKPDLTRVKEFHERTGFVLKVIGGLDGEVPRDKIGAVLTYILSHAGVAFRPSGRMVKQLSYFGDISTRAVHKVDSKKDPVLSECPVCGDPLYDLSDLAWFLRGHAKPIVRINHLAVLSRDDRETVGFITNGMEEKERFAFYREHPEHFAIVSDHPLPPPRGPAPVSVPSPVRSGVPRASEGSPAEDPPADPFPDSAVPEVLPEVPPAEDPAPVPDLPIADAMQTSEKIRRKKRKNRGGRRRNAVNSIVFVTGGKF